MTEVIDEPIVADEPFPEGPGPVAPPRRTVGQRVRSRIVRRPRNWLDAPWTNERIARYLTALLIVGGTTFSVLKVVHLNLVFENNTPTGGGPAVITIHGGSWRGGKRSDFAHWDRWFAAHGYTVFDIDYRMSPAPNWRISSGDVRAAIGWVKRNSAIYHVDPDRLAVLGRSAGGQLALIAAYTPGAPASPPSDGTPTDTHVRAVISLYGPTDLVWGYNNSLVPDIIRGPQTLSRYLGGSPTEVPAAYAAASPIEHVAPQTPPTLLFHGSRDSLVGVAHTERLSARLSQAGIPHQAVYFPYATHGFDFDINGWASQIEQPIVLRFLHTYLAKRP